MPLVVLLYALFASLFTFSKATLEVSPPCFLVGSRMLISGFVLLLTLFIFKRETFLRIWQRRILCDYVLFGLIAIYLANILEVWGIEVMSSSRACFIFSACPFVSAILSYLVLGESLGSRQLAGISVGFIGVLPLQLSSSGESFEASSLFGGTASLLTATVAGCYGWILLQRLVKVHSQPLLAVNGVAMLAGGAAALIHSYCFEAGWRPFPVADYWVFIVNTAAMAIISNCICYNLYGYLLQKYSATFMSLAGLMTPIFASIYGSLFLGEQLTWHFFLSFALFACGLMLFHTSEIGVRAKRRA